MWSSPVFTWFSSDWRSRDRLCKTLCSYKSLGSTQTLNLSVRWKNLSPRAGQTFAQKLNRWSRGQRDIANNRTLLPQWSVLCSGKRWRLSIQITIPTGKQGDGSIMLWNCFARNWTDRKIDFIMSEAVKYFDELVEGCVWFKWTN